MNQLVGEMQEKLSHQLPSEGTVLGQSTKGTCGGDDNYLPKDSRSKQDRMRLSGKTYPL